jgi:hypothetical protein
MESHDRGRIRGCRWPNKCSHASGVAAKTRPNRNAGQAGRDGKRRARRHLQGATRRPHARCRDGRPGVARSHECREGATGSCRTDSETRKFRKRVSARCAAQTCKARKGRIYRRLLSSSRSRGSARSDWRQGDHANPAGRSRSSRSRSPGRRALRPDACFAQTVIAGSTARRQCCAGNRCW